MAAACTHPDRDPRLSPPLVSVAVVSSAAPGRHGYTGVVVARVQSDLGFRVPGKIVARMVDTGQTVSRGRPLMRIDPTDYALAAAAGESGVTAARARALQTAADEKRCRKLLAAGAMSASAYDLAKASADSAAADLSAAQDQLDVARREAAYSVLAADADGVIVDTLGEPGQVVTAGQTVVRLAHSGPREAEVNFPETLRLAVGSAAHARLYDRPELFAAKLRQISSEADSHTRTFDARYVLEGAAADAPLGATVTILVADPPGASTTRVP
jgi:RND family efflux transporter MFP subunit